MNFILKVEFNMNLILKVNRKINCEVGYKIKNDFWKIYVQTWYDIIVEIIMIYI